MLEYYERRAPEYDDWYRGTGLFAERDRPGWEGELEELVAAIASLPPARTLDVACGTGFLTRHLPGSVVAVDTSAAMLDEARVGAPKAALVQCDALALPFPNESFERVFTSHFYGHLEESDRLAFLAEARRVGRELVVVDSAGTGAEWQERTLNDGTRWRVYKRWFTPGLLVEEIGGEPFFAGRFFVGARS